MKNIDNEEQKLLNINDSLLRLIGHVDFVRSLISSAQMWKKNMNTLPF